MADEVCSVCSKGGAKRCSNCKLQYYCSKECQKKDWKIHKGICKEIAETSRKKKFSSARAGIPSEISNTQKDMYTQLLSTFSGVGLTKLIPEYHKEYKKLYPREKTNYDMLRDSWIMAKSLDESLFGDRVIDAGRDYDHRDLSKRWQYFGPELAEFLSTNPKPGDIFTGRVVNPYGTISTTTGLYSPTVYQTMRNTPVHPMDFQFGNTYISIGFVDIFHLLIGSFNEPESEATTQPLNLIGYDKSEVVIARSMVIYEMMLNGICPDSILQVWFSTGWSEKTQEDFKKTCDALVKSANHTLPENVKKLLCHWTVTQVGVKTVQPLWRQLVGEYQLEPLRNLRYEKDRTDYARYMFTGQIFGKNDKDYVYGNVTMFCLPKEFDYHRQDQNFFAAWSLKDFKYGTSLLASVTERVKTGLDTLMQHIQNKQIVCKFVLKDLTLNDTATLEEIRKYDAKVLDWSNIPDYLPKDDFFTMAKACSGTNTTHSMHYMNWQGHVFGTSLMDYPDKSRVYKGLKKEMADKYDEVKKSRPFFRQDQYVLYYMNVADQMLSAKYRKQFLDYVMKGMDVLVTEPTSEDFNPFERSSACFFVSFSFKKN